MVLKQKIKCTEGESFYLQPYAIHHHTYKKVNYFMKSISDTMHTRYSWGKNSISDHHASTNKGENKNDILNIRLFL